MAGEWRRFGVRMCTVEMGLEKTLQSRPPSPRLCSGTLLHGSRQWTKISSLTGQDEPCQTFREGLLRCETCSRIFKVVLKWKGLPPRSGKVSPRLHDLRTPGKSLTSPIHTHVSSQPPLRPSLRPLLHSDVRFPELTVRLLKPEM